MADCWDRSFLIDVDGCEHAYHLASDRYVPVVDAPPMPPAPRDGCAAPPRPRRPEPNGDENWTAYGINYRDEWPRFGYATILYHTICAPPEVFVDPDALIDPDTDWYYLTATNGAARGVEAFLSYWHVRNPELWVYDWSIPECGPEAREYGPISYPALAPYWQTVDTDTGPIPGIYVVNATTSIDDDGLRWRNTVLLYRPGTDTTAPQFDRVYTRDYDATAAEQWQDGTRRHFWGPILESGTDAQRFETHPAGFTDVGLLLDADIVYLSPSNSCRSGDDPSASVVHLRPNHALLVAMRPSR